MFEMKGLFVTGTDTGIGKTLCSAILINALRKTQKVCYWKPIQTGIEEDNDTLTVKNLANCAEDEIFDCGFRLERPLSPHLSARFAQTEVSVEKTLKFIENENNAEKFFIVEGAGGVLVPLNDDELMIDLMQRLNLPVVVVARAALGTINHTLLTLQALRGKNLRIFGVVMSGEPNLENRRAIEQYGKVRVLAEIPKFATINSDIVKNWTEQNKNAFA